MSLTTPKVATTVLLNDDNFWTPALSERVAICRDKSTPNPQFRKAMADIGEVLGFALAEQLGMYDDQEIVLTPILRAGLALYAGVARAIPESSVGYIAGRRSEEPPFKPTVYFGHLPLLARKHVALIDPMFATGGTIEAAIQYVNEHDQLGRPASIHVLSAFTAKPGLDAVVARLEEKTQIPVHIVTAALDPVLNDTAYIVPGCGDAGDRCYSVAEDLGEKRPSAPVSRLQVKLPRLFRVDGDLPRDHRRKLGTFVGNKLSARLPYAVHEVESPLGTTKYDKVKDPVIICDLPGHAFFEGVHDVFPDADTGFIYRRGDRLYTSVPNLNGRDVLFLRSAIDREDDQAVKNAQFLRERCDPASFIYVEATFAR